MSTPTSTASKGPGVELWTFRGLVAKYPRASFAAAGLVVAMVVSLVLAVALGTNAGAVTDATTCTQWGSTTQNRQSAYAALYLKEHGAIPHWGGSRADVLNAINWGCGLAYGDDVSDTTTVDQAINGTF
jgi:hypothetical protein